jgi:cell division inhibitor SepF
LEGGSDMRITDKLWDLFGIQTEIEEEYDDLPVLPKHETKSGVTVVSSHFGKGLKVIVCKPERLEEAQSLADHLKNKEQVILNFENTLPEISQKIIDFIDGAVYALDGHSQKLGQNVFLFAPAWVEIIKDKRSSLCENDISPFETYGR